MQTAPSRLRSAELSWVSMCDAESRTGGVAGPARVLGLLPVRGLRRGLRWPPDTRPVTASSSPHRLGHMTRLSQRQPVRSARCLAHVVVSLCAARDGPCPGPGKEQGHPSVPGGTGGPGAAPGQEPRGPRSDTGYRSAWQPCWDMSPFLKLALRSLPVWAFYETVTAGLTLSIRRHSACADVVPGVRESQ